MRQPFGEGNFAHLRDTPFNGTAPLAPTIRRPDFLLAAIITCAFFVFHGHLLFQAPALTCHTLSLATPGTVFSEETHARQQRAHWSQRTREIRHTSLNKGSRAAGFAATSSWMEPVSIYSPWATTGTCFWSRLVVLPHIKTIRQTLLFPIITSDLKKTVCNSPA